MELLNYVKLDSVLYNTTQYLKDNESKGKKVNGLFASPKDMQMLIAFNTIIATGYYQIVYNNDSDLIKTNFDYTGSNRNVILDFDTKHLKTLLNTDIKTSEGKQGTLI